MRAGFTLVEVLVSITVLSVAVLCMAASGALAAGLLRTAEREEAAARLAGSLLDSLVLVPDAGSGTVSSGDLFARWEGSRGGTIAVWVSYTDAGSPRVHYWSARSLSDLPRASSPADTLP
jgi:prepilin-type N-terminal cleavage/methylation domain-containing protein